MRILRLHLKNYKRLLMSNIADISVEYSGAISVIIGANGSGKSSLLHELSPLPANAADYTTPGLKEVEVEHKGVNYLLRSIMGKGAKHEFIRDGVELNTGHTATVQRDLVDSHMDFTPLMHKLLIGGLHFTEMTPLTRREILTSITTLNLDYANGVWDKLRISHRDKLGALKHVVEKQEQLKSTLLSMGDLDSISQESQSLHREIKALTPLSINTAVDVVGEHANLVAATETLETIIADFKSSYRTLSDRQFTSRESLMTALTTAQREEHSNNTIITQTVTEIDELSRLTQVVENNDNGIEQLESRVVEINTALITLSLPGHANYQSNLKNALEGLKTLSSSLYQLYSDKDATAQHCTVADHQKLKASLTTLMQEEQAVQVGITKLTTHISHAEAAIENLVICPDCHTKIGRDKLLPKETLAAYRDRLIKGTAKLQVITLSLDRLRSQLTQESLYLVYQTQFIATIRQYPDTLAFWTQYTTLLWAVDNHPQVEDDLRLEITALTNQVTHNTLTQELKELNNTISIYKIAGASGACQQKAKATDKLNHCYSQATALTQQIKGYNIIKKRYDDLIGADATITRALQDIATAFVHWSDAVSHHTVGKELHAVQSRLATIEGSLAKKRQMTESLTTLNTDHTRLRAEQEALKALIKTLSPKDGVIAEQMTGFVNSFMDQVNAVITEVWDYTLAVEPPTMEERGLDYKFPLVVDNALVPEISKGSLGQRDIINFAFTVVLRAYLNMEDYPIYLDELGSSFDHTHRASLIEYLKRIVEGGYCSQMHIISHFASAAASFSNAEYVVLTDNHVILDPTVKQIAKIIYYQ